jgi:hypothetical protein
MEMNKNIGLPLTHLPPNLRIIQIDITLIHSRALEVRGEDLMCKDVTFLSISYAQSHHPWRCYFHNKCGEHHLL